MKLSRSLLVMALCAGCAGGQKGEIAEVAPELPAPGDPPLMRSRNVALTLGRALEREDEIAEHYRSLLEAARASKEHLHASRAALLAAILSLDETAIEIFSRLEPMPAMARHPFFDTPIPGWGSFSEAADAVQCYALAFAVLKPRIAPDAAARIRERLLASVAPVALRGVELAPPAEALRIASALGTLALLIPDDPGAQAWRTLSFDKILASLEQTIVGGVHRAGLLHLSSSLRNLIPLMRQLDAASALDPKLRQRIDRAIDFVLKAESPIGAFPAFDDSYPLRGDDLTDTFISYAPIAGAPDRIWAFVARHPRELPDSTGGPLLFYGLVDRAALASRPAEKAPAPAEDAQFLEAGVLILKSGGESATYAAFTNQGRSVTERISHKHHDPTSFVMSAFGQWLVIDPGYGPGGWNAPASATQHAHEWYQSSEAHSVPKVRGRWPHVEPTSLDRLAALPPDAALSAACGATTAHVMKVDTHRRFVFELSNGRIAVADSYAPGSEVEWGLHVLGEPQTSGKGMFTVNHEDAALTIHVFAESNLAPETKPAWHSVDADPKGERTHTRLVFKGITTWLAAVLEPHRPGAEIAPLDEACKKVIAATIR